MPARFENFRYPSFLSKEVIKKHDPRERSARQKPAKPMGGAASAPKCERAFSPKEALKKREQRERSARQKTEKSRDGEPSALRSGDRLKKISRAVPSYFEEIHKAKRRRTMYLVHPEKQSFSGPATSFWKHNISVKNLISDEAFFVDGVFTLFCRSWGINKFPFLTFTAKAASDTGKNGILSGFSRRKP